MAEKNIEVHVLFTPEEYARLLKYKTAKYNGLRAMGKVIRDFCKEGLDRVEGKTK